MKLIKKTIFIVFVYILVCFGNGALLAQEGIVTEELGIIECIEFALENHPDIGTAEFAVFEAEMELKRLQLEDPKAVAKKDYLQAELAVEQAKEALNEVAMNLALEIERKYYQILKQIHNLNNKKFSLERSEVQMKVVQIKYNSGLIPEKDLLAMQENLKEAEKSYNRALFDFDTAKMEFNFTLGRDLEHFFEFKDREFPYEPLETDLQSATQYALENSKNMKRARSDLKKAQEDLELKMQNEVAELELKKAEHRVKEAEIRLERAEQQIIISMRATYMSFASSQDLIEKTTKSLEEAKRNLEVLTIKYEAGMIPLSDLFSGEKALNDAEVQCIQVIYDYNLAKASFNQSIGKGYSLYQTIAQQGSDI